MFSLLRGKKRPIGTGDDELPVKCKQDGQVRRSRSIEGALVGDLRHQVLGPEQVRGFPAVKVA